MTERREDFDWVTARGLCSPAQVFETLRMQVDRDVAIRISLIRQEPKQYKLSIANDDKKFSVLVEGHEVYRVARFALTDAGIDVYDAPDRLKIHAGLTLGDDGECRLKVGDKEYDLWQFRRLALEEILFID